MAFKAHVYRIAVVNPNNDAVLYVAEVVGVEAKRAVLKDAKTNWSNVEIVEKDLGWTKKDACTGKNYEIQGCGKYTVNTRRADIEKMSLRLRHFA